MFNPFKKIRYNARLRQVKEHYRQYTPLYLSVTGDFIQAFRTSNVKYLTQQIIAKARLQDGDAVLDTGSGVSAVSIAIANALPKSSVSGITISELQVETANEKIKAAGLSARVSTRLGDYHQLQNYFSAAQFDRVLFLESLGHHIDLNAVISGAFAVLKSGGTLYIKDLFINTDITPQQADAASKVINKINTNYAYNTLRIDTLKAALQQAGFVIDSFEQPAYISDLGLLEAFEKQAGMDLHKDLVKLDFLPTLWYEVVCTKP